MECFELDISALFFQQIHNQFEVLWIRNVFRKNHKVCTIQEQLAQQLKNIYE